MPVTPTRTFGLPGTNHKERALASFETAIDVKLTDGIWVARNLRYSEVNGRYLVITLEGYLDFDMKVEMVDRYKKEGWGDVYIRDDIDERNNIEFGHWRIYLFELGAS